MSVGWISTVMVSGLGLAAMSLLVVSQPAVGADAPTKQMKSQAKPSKLQHKLKPQFVTKLEHVRRSTARAAKEEALSVSFREWDVAPAESASSRSVTKSPASYERPAPSGPPPKLV